ncbi:MCE family protein [Amycolatopsis sp. K13G38]|uniref:MCE family protein n=1 Tax=Amycolatopsis acididurans TaxID=2724524 RepID=A0ABX1JD84_9PSEU|nr:MlaD family protein [Amycolatopsis acididurans]NKQ57750.1 MCE family protein [Amycolatopsis acididurans]
MIQRGIKIQLAVFALVALTALAYAVVRFTGVTDLASPPYTVHATFAEPGGIYPRAEVDLLGTPVGTVRDLTLEPDGKVSVNLTMNNGVRVPTDVTATVAQRSALGEQYVELTPGSAGGPFLQNESVIPVSRTRTPVPVKNLLGDLDGLAKSVPTKDLDTTLRELATAFGGTGPDLQHLLDDGNSLTRSSLANLHDQIGLMDSSATVLDTQVAAGAQITTLTAQLAGLTDELRDLDSTFPQTFANGIRAGSQVTGLLAENEAALPQLLNHLITLTDVTLPRLQGVRKTLVVFPWVLQAEFGAIRYCDDNDPATGKPIQSTCHYDPATGQPLWTQHFGAQLSQTPGKDPSDDPCVNGYQGTKRYLPNGAPADGQGPAETADTPANLNAHCAASPYDPRTPNVRGAQNADTPTGASPPGPSGPSSGAPAPGGGHDMAMYDPNSGDVVATDGSAYHLSGLTGGPIPQGPDGLGWLLTAPLTAQGG